MEERDLGLSPVFGLLGQGPSRGPNSFLLLPGFIELLQLEANSLRKRGTRGLI